MFHYLCHSGKWQESVSSQQSDKHTLCPNLREGLDHREGVRCAGHLLYFSGGHRHYSQ